MFLHLLTENFHQCGVHEFVVVGNEKADAPLRRELLGEFLLQPLLVPLLHHHHDIRPAKLTGGDFDARRVFRSR